MSNLTKAAGFLLNFYPMTILLANSARSHFVRKINLIHTGADLPWVMGVHLNTEYMWAINTFILPKPARERREGAGALTGVCEEDQGAASAMRTTGRRRLLWGGGASESGPEGAAVPLGRGGGA